MNVIWSGLSNQNIIWAGTVGGVMIQYRMPVRANTPQLFRYTFKDETGVVISLSNYVATFLEVKLQGQIFQSSGGTILTNGQVQSSPSAFPTPGVYDAQFYVTDMVGSRLYGQPVQFTVVPNVDDLTLSQLPSY